MSAIKPNDTALVAKWLNEKGTDVLKKLYQNFQTATIVRRFGGVRQSLDLATFDNVKKLIRGYKKDATTQADEFEYGKITLSVAKFMVALDVTYMEDEVEAFVAYLIDAGENLGELTEDMLGERFILWLIGQSQEVMDAELEDAIWQAILVTSGGNSAADAAMIHKFSGLRRQAATLASAGKGTIINTGAITSANAVDKVELFYGGFDKQIKRTGAYIFCSYALFDNYKIHYRSMNSGRELGVTRHETLGYEMASIYLGGGKVYLVPVQGIGDDDVLIGCRPQDIALGYDTLGSWDVQKERFTLLALAAMKFGVTFLMQRPGYLVVNDRLIAVEITTPRTNA